MAALKKEIGFNHLSLRIMRGSVLQNEIYCSKEGKLVHFGLAFIGKGGRRDAQIFYEKIKSGANDLDLADHDFNMFARFIRATDRVRLAVTPPQREEPRQIILYYGASDQGKSRLAMQTYPNLFKVPYSRNLWIDGYQQQKVVLFEEFSGEIPLKGALQLFDPWQTQRFEIKCAFVWFTPDIVIITSNIHPRDWYDFSNRKKQEVALRRRFSSVIEFKADGRRVKYSNAESITRFWPIHDYLNDNPVRDDPSNPIQAALANGILCHNCYVVPCACRIDRPLPMVPEAPEPLGDEDEV